LLALAILIAAASLLALAVNALLPRPAVFSRTRLVARAAHANLSVGAIVVRLTRVRTLPAAANLPETTIAIVGAAVFAGSARATELSVRAVIIIITRIRADSPGADLARAAIHVAIARLHTRPVAAADHVAIAFVVALARRHTDSPDADIPILTFGIALTWRQTLIVNTQPALAMLIQRAFHALTVVTVVQLIRILRTVFVLQTLHTLVILVVAILSLSATVFTCAGTAVIAAHAQRTIVIATALDASAARSALVIGRTSHS